MCWNYIRKFRVTILMVIILCYGGYEVLHQKMLENQDIKKRLEKLKPTVPSSLYDEVSALHWKLVKANFKNLILQKKLWLTHLILQKGETSLHSPKYLDEVSMQSMVPKEIISTRTDERKATVAYGIPINDIAVKENLFSLLTLLIKYATMDDFEETIYIVYINLELHKEKEKLVSSLQTQFKDQIDNGILDLVISSSNYYPSYKSIEESFGNSRAVMIKNSKFNLDMAYLMMYARTRAAFYIHLTPDVQPVPQYASKIAKFTIKKASSKEHWLELSFSTHLCSGKLYHSKDIDRLVTFLLMYHAVKPCDWIIYGLIGTIYCHLEKTCYGDKEIKKHRIQYRPVLFKKQRRI